MWLVALPFFLLWLVALRRPLRSPLVAARSPRSRRRLLAANLLFSEIDHEVLRFLGVRLNPRFLCAYGQPAMLARPALPRRASRTDQGGAFLSLVLLIARFPALYLWWALALLRRRARRTAPVVAGARCSLWCRSLAPANGWRQATGLFRLRKVEPVLIAFAADSPPAMPIWRRPADFAALAADYRRALARPKRRPRLALSRPRAALSARARPGRRRRGQRWNVIYLQLETLRGVDMGYFNPSGAPLGHALSRPAGAEPGCRASGPARSASECRASTACSPPIARSRRTRGATSPRFTDVSFRCLPELLRARGYRAEMFNGGDTDWDNSSRWHRASGTTGSWRYPEAARARPEVFRAAAVRIRRLGRSGPAVLRHHRLGQQSHALHAAASPRSTSPARRRPPSASATPPIIPTTSSASSIE